MSTKIAVVISEGRDDCSAQQKLTRELEQALVGWSAVAVTILPHLYDLAPDGPGIGGLRAIAGDMIVLSRLYPRAAYWVLDAHRIQGCMGRTSFLADEELETPAAVATETDTDAADRNIWCIDLRDHDQAKPVLQEIRRIVEQATGKPLEDVDRRGDTAGDGATRIEEAAEQRWYPVVDRSRCTNCLECLNFCLFGVFTVDDLERLLVSQPDACRDGCPACSRVCPSAAIMFPHYDNPAIAGASNGSPESIGVEFVQLLGDTNLMDRAAAERKQAFSKKAQTDPPKDKSKETDELDRLVDELDQMDLD
jgi:NAD-dependent dihydropyrimidine dehydrogenase PreA subunit